jgi:ribonuclease D
VSKITLIAEQGSWEQLAAKLAGEPELAVDTESNSLYTYREKVCLIQLGSARESFLLDPLAVPDLSSLGNLLANPAIVKVLHGSDYDLRSLNRDYDFRIQPLFDTQVAARFLGDTTPNLASVLESSLGVKIPKSRRLQTSNWGLRPLSSAAQEYAAGDVDHLIPLAERLRERLLKAGRLDWVREECQRLEQVRYTPPAAPEAAFLRLKGSDRLSPRELAVLKELFLFREAAAQRLDCATFRVMANENLLQLALSAAAETGAGRSQEAFSLNNVPGLSPQLLQRSGDSLREAIERGRRGPEFQRPHRPRNNDPWTPQARRRLQELKKWRIERGEKLGLDPALLWPAVSLERMASHPESQEAELMATETPANGTDVVRAWQRREFAEEIQEVLTSPGADRGL